MSTNVTRKLAGKVALVTGGSRGIGAAIAKWLAADGAAVAVTYSTSPAKADEVVRSIKAAGGKALAIKADAADTEAVRLAIAKTIGAFGGIDILVNNAGVGIMAPIEQFSLEDFDKGPFKNNFRFWRERRRARCEARGGSIPHSGAVTDEQGSRWPDAAPPLRAGALWLAGFVAHSSQTAAGMLVARASPASQRASSKIGIYF